MAVLVACARAHLVIATAAPATKCEAVQGESVDAPSNMDSATALLRTLTEQVLLQEQALRQAHFPWILRQETHGRERLQDKQGQTSRK
jgi:hypothetical protein